MDRRTSGIPYLPVGCALLLLTVGLLYSLRWERPGGDRPRPKTVDAVATAASEARETSALQVSRAEGAGTGLVALEVLRTMSLTSRQLGTGQSKPAPYRVALESGPPILLRGTVRTATGRQLTSLRVVAEGEYGPRVDTDVTWTPVGRSFEGHFSFSVPPARYTIKPESSSGFDWDPRSYVVEESTYALDFLCRDDVPVADYILDIRLCSFPEESVPCVIDLFTRSADGTIHDVGVPGEAGRVTLLRHYPINAYVRWIVGHPGCRPVEGRETDFGGLVVHDGVTSIVAGVQLQPGYGQIFHALGPDVDTAEVDVFVDDVWYGRTDVLGFVVVSLAAKPTVIRFVGKNGERAECWASVEPRSFNTPLFLK